MTSSSASSPSSQEWRAAVAPYRTASVKRSLWQIANTILPFLFIWFAMYWALDYSIWLTLALLPVAGGLLIRIFIIFHDCGHGSFFVSQRANHILGAICGVLSWTPYFHWRHFHALHHASSGDLDRRIDGQILPLTIAKYTQSTGDVLTLTVKEYEQLSGWERMTYRVYRHPIVLFGIIPITLFSVLQRFSDGEVKRREKMSVWGTNLALLAICALQVWAFGFWPFVLIQFGMLALTSTIGVWLFYVQHQFEETYWAEHEEWDYARAALEGSSYYQLPKVLQWFSGNIGFHHIHHLSPRIPNYYLEACHKANPMFQQARPITLRTGMKSVDLRLWDEENRRLISFREFDAREQAAQAAGSA